MGTNNELYTQVEELQRRVEQNPEVGLEIRDRLNRWLVHNDARIRYASVDILIKMSASYPVELRELCPRLVSRLDDTDVSVRVAALTAIYNLARWYPQEFGHTTELLYQLLSESDVEEEQASAAGVISRIAFIRPDLVTPREQIRTGLLEFLEAPDAEQVLDSCNVGVELVESAIDVLEGGDMASRPVESDLAPIPRNTSLSKPAQTGFKSIVWGVMFPFIGLIGLISALRFAYRFRHLTPMGRAKILVSETEKLKFFTNTKRRSLYLRASMFPTPTQLMPFLPGRSPISENRLQQTSPLPDDWGVRSQLVRQRDEYRCRNCGVGGGPNGSAELHVDHQTPRSAGGGDDPENLRTLCRECHEARHARVFDQ